MAGLIFTLLKLAFHAGEAVAAAELEKKQAAPPPKKRATPGRLLVTDEMRSMIASVFVGTLRMRSEFGGGAPNHSLCCAADKHEACLAIVGRRNARAASVLADFFYESLGCAILSELDGDAESEANQERVQYYLDKIANLEEL